MTFPKYFLFGGPDFGQIFGHVFGQVFDQVFGQVFDQGFWTGKDSVQFYRDEEQLGKNTRNILSKLP